MQVDTNWGKVELPEEPNVEALKKDGVVTTFTFGHCHSLALAIHELTGWPLVGLYRLYRPWSNMEETPDHVVVKTPKGKLLDISGLDNVRGYSGEVKFTKDEVERFRDYRKPDTKMARPFAVVLLRSISQIE